jgi:hypothetical protein
MKRNASAFRRELEHLINCQGMENGSNTPDFILADYLMSCLQAFDAAVERRERWHGRKGAGDETNAISETEQGASEARAPIQCPSESVEKGKPALQDL